MFPYSLCSFQRNISPECFMISREGILKYLDIQAYFLKGIEPIYVDT